MKKAAISLLLIILFTALAISASAATIYPMQNSVSIGRLQGLELPVDISWEGGWEARVTIYSYDLYSVSDLSRIRPGDSIMIDGKLEKVYTAEWVLSYSQFRYRRGDHRSQCPVHLPGLPGSCQ